MVGELWPDENVIALLGEPARVIGPTLSRMTMNWPNLGYAVTHLQIGSALEPYLDRYRLRNQDTLRAARLADSPFLDGNSAHHSKRIRPGPRGRPGMWPCAGDTAQAQAQYWTGLRPATPGNVPLVGRTGLGRLFLNTGHGALGWPHAYGSGKSIARIVSGLHPEPDFAFVGA